MDKFMPVLATVVGGMSIIASFGVIYALHRVQTLIELAIGKFEAEKENAEDTLMAIANVIQERKK